MFVNDIIAEKSYEFIFKIKNLGIDFVLLGGWVCYFYTRALKSKDIDIAVDLNNFLLLRRKFDVNINEKLKKFEIKTQFFDIGIYVEKFSKLVVDIREILKNFTIIDGIKVVNPDLLLILKLDAFKRRYMSISGEKDKYDLFFLLNYLLETYPENKICELIKEYNQVDSLTLLIKSLDLKILKEIDKEFMKKYKKVKKLLKII